MRSVAARTLLGLLLQGAAAGTLALGTDAGTVITNTATLSFEVDGASQPLVEMPDGRVLTPALSCGLLPGILREELLENKAVAEAVLTLTDLKNAQTVRIGNSLRGLIEVELIDG